MQIREKFLKSQIPQDFYWFNEPKKYYFGKGLEIFTDSETDFWQNTHYGFKRDNGHCLLKRHANDFTMLAHMEFHPREKYDQCGLIVRIDSQNWIKVSTEYENDKKSRLGSVVTNFGYSDWATKDIASTKQHMWYRISKHGKDFLIENSNNGREWIQMRITHLHKETEYCEIGVYSCSPIGEDFRSICKVLEISDNKWLH
jgi:regulation of enolase protein 1 (concanavalin A-like superfamily)